MDPQENKLKMACGELYYAFTPELIAERDQCMIAQVRFNSANGSSRREMVKLWRDIIQDKTPMPPQLSDPVEDENQFSEEPWVQQPVHFDYGYNVKVGSNVFINFNATFIDTCAISIGSRTMFGPNVSVFSGTHPLDPVIRNGTKGPETGKPVSIGEDCWIGGNAIILPGITIGKGSTVGAGSVVTKDVPPYHVVAGNPAKIIRKINTSMDPEQEVTVSEDSVEGAEKPMASLQ